MIIQRGLEVHIKILSKLLSLSVGMITLLVDWSHAVPKKQDSTKKKEKKKFKLHIILQRTLVKGVEEINSDLPKDSQEYKLMFAVRDWIGLDKFGFGLANGKDYIEPESKRVSVNLIAVTQKIFIDVGNMKYIMIFIW